MALGQITCTGNVTDTASVDSPLQSGTYGQAEAIKGNYSSCSNEEWKRKWCSLRYSTQDFLHLLLRFPNWEHPRTFWRSRALYFRQDYSRLSSLKAPVSQIAWTVGLLWVPESPTVIAVGSQCFLQHCLSPFRKLLVQGSNTIPRCVNWSPEDSSPRRASEALEDPLYCLDLGFFPEGTGRNLVLAPFNGSSTTFSF